MKRQTRNYLYTAVAAACALALTGCVSFAPVEPIKNPPTVFRSDNVVDIEFLLPAKVGLRCGERGTQAFGMPVFHAMACGNGKLITMPDPCDTFTAGAYAALMCQERSRPATKAVILPEWQALLQPAGYTPDTRPAPTPLKARAQDTFSVEFVHPAAVRQRCRTRGLEVSVSESGDFAACSDGAQITMPNPCMSLEAGWYPRTLCHEMAHANGWAMDHPGGSFLSDARIGVDPNDVPPPRAVLASLYSDRPLRRASESPAYLAFAAAQAGARTQDDAFAASLQLASLKAPAPAADAFGPAPAVTLTASQTPDFLMAALSFGAAPLPPARDLGFAARVADLHGAPSGQYQHMQLAAASANLLRAPRSNSGAPPEVRLHQAALSILPPAAPAEAPKPSQPLWFVRAVRETAEGTFAALSDALRAAAVAGGPLIAVAEPAPEPAPEAPSAKPALRPSSGRDKFDRLATGV